MAELLKVRGIRVDTCYAGLTRNDAGSKLSRSGTQRGRVSP